MSRRLLPKQFLPLVSKYSLLQDTVLRLRSLPHIEAPIIVANNEHRFLVAEQMREIGVKSAFELLEPEGRNTAPAVAAAALAALSLDSEALLLVLPADHLVADIEGFRAAVTCALPLAESGLLVTFGIKPTAPATGFGYIERGASANGRSDAYEIKRFVEKPSEARATEFLATGRFYWNSGMFVLSAKRYLDELESHAPNVLATVTTAWKQAVTDLDFTRLDGQAFCDSPSISIDVAVFEKTKHAAVVPADLGWSDVGTWAALWELGDQDARGNVLRGDVHVHDTDNCYVRAETRLVAAVGIRDLVVVETADAVLVTNRNEVQHVKTVVDHLEHSERKEHISHRRVFRPWGYYEQIDGAQGYQVKRIMVKPGHALSLQRHRHRAEHWVVVSGQAEVTRDEETITLMENQSTYIPIGTRHRLRNPGAESLFLIEVQSGSYLGEDDIERLEDNYGRS